VVGSLYVNIVLDIVHCVRYWAVDSEQHSVC
jgi:hypothetical protein